MTRFINGNDITLLRNGAEYFPALFLAISNAQQEIHLQSYIYQEDNIGIEVGNALKQAVKRGVNVNILLDGFGSKDLSKSFIQALKNAGVHIKFYRSQISPWSLKKSRLRRMHCKMAVIDGNIGFVGGINIINDFDMSQDATMNIAPRIDYAVRVEGAILPAMQASMYKLWNRLEWFTLVKNVKSVDEETFADKGIKAAFVIRDNVMHRRDIEHAYLQAIHHASSEIIIANAYFLPGKRFRKALLNASKRGVKITLLLQGRMEYILMFSTHAFYNDFLKNGIQIYEYQKSFMHSKVAVIDGEWATVGSSNIDPFSLLLAREANVFIKDAHFAAELRNDILATINHGAELIKFEDWLVGSKLKRVASWLMYMLVRLFLNLIGYANEQ